MTCREQRPSDGGLAADKRRFVLYHLALDKMAHGFDQAVFDVHAAAWREANDRT